MVLYASAGSIPLSFPHVLPFYGSAKAEVHANTVRAGTYTVRIRGNDTTYPEIYATEFKNIVVYRDTTLNFAVERYFRNEAHIYSDSTKQMIRGFGGMNMPGWIPDMTSAQVNKAFGVNDGQIGMSILRVRVPFDSSKFYLEVPTAKHAASLGATIIASPWSPPAWMKSNNNIVGGILKESAYGAYANHLQSFANYLSGNGVTLQAVSIQNEPDVTVTYESCDWNASQMSKFLKENGQFIGPNIIAPESFHFNSTFADSLLNDPATAANISIIGGHIYGGGLAPYPLAAKKGKELWMTEHLVVNTDWNGALETAKEINDCMLADMNAYIWWYIRRFYGPIDDNSVVTKRGYVISQYARFVRPGYHRIGATPLSQMYVDITAFRNDSTIVIVAVNRATTGLEQAFVIHNGNVNTFMSYSTSSTKNCVKGSDISILNGKFTVTLDASSVTTFVSK
jgi:glucuronoarabinoxylan endo-1,4-beta-xylanase